MIEACIGYLKERVLAALGVDRMGAPPQVFMTLETLKASVNPHVGAIIFDEGGDVLTWSGRQLRNLDTKQDDLVLFDRSVTFLVTLGESKTEQLAPIFETFLTSLDRGFTHEGHYIAIELPRPADWVDRKDSVINSEIAVELPITFSGGVYRTQTFKQFRNVVIEREESNG